MFVNIIKSTRDIVAVCDSDLIGEKFEEGEIQLDVKEDFYKGEEVSYEKAVEIMRDMAKEDATFNIVGEEAVEAAIEAGIIDEGAVRKVEGVSFSLVLI